MYLRCFSVLASQNFHLAENDTFVRKTTIKITQYAQCPDSKYRLLKVQNQLAMAENTIRKCECDYQPNNTYMPLACMYLRLRRVRGHEVSQVANLLILLELRPMNVNLNKSREIFTMTTKACN